MAWVRFHHSIDIQRERSSRPANLAINAPMTVPKAAHIAITKSMEIQRSASEGAGNPMKRVAAKRVENAKGQISRGRERPDKAAQSKVANATRALKGRTRMTEKSTIEC